MTFIGFLLVMVLLSMGTTLAPLGVGIPLLAIAFALLFRKQ